MGRWKHTVVHEVSDKTMCEVMAQIADEMSREIGDRVRQWPPQACGSARWVRVNEEYVMALAEWALEYMRMLAEYEHVDDVNGEGW